MKRARFSYLKLAAVLAVLAMALVPSMRTSTATNQPALAVIPDANLANEERVIFKYDDDLVAYDKQSAEVGKRARLVSADLDAIQSRSDDLKGRLSGVQNAVREIVKKLKAANEWDDLDTSVAARFTDSSQRSFFQQSSFKQLLEESSNNLTSHGNEISTPLDNLRKRLTSRYGGGADFQIVRAGYEAPAPAAFVSVRCSIGGARLGLIKRLGGYATNATWDTVSCACGNTTGLGTGIKCSDLKN